MGDLNRARRREHFIGQHLLFKGTYSTGQATSAPFNLYFPETFVFGNSTMMM